MKRITNCIFLLLGALLVTGVAHAQQAPSEATNIRITNDEQTKKLVILYDLPSVQPNDSLYVEIETASGRRFRPITVSGNIGKKLTPGRDKAIYWDVVRDNVQLNEEVEVIIRISRTGKIARPAPTTAAAQPPRPAATQPAVATPKKSVLPIVGWVVTGGAAAYTFILASGLNKDVDAYNQNTVANTLADWNAAEVKRKDIDSRRGTVTIVAGATAVLLVANIIYTVVRASSGTAAIPSTQPRLAWRIQPSSQSLGIGLVRTF